MKRLSVAFKPTKSTIENVGTIVQVDRKTYFEYDKSFLEKQINISPFKLKLTNELQEKTDNYPSELFGVFDDSLPDGWGMLLMDRYFRKQNKDLRTISGIDRLAFVADNAMGGLVYYPAEDSLEHFNEQIDLLKLAENSMEVLQGKTNDILPVMAQAGGSPGGARPKIKVGYDGKNLISDSENLSNDYERWLIKFNSENDFKDAGKIEYVYYQMAKNAGLNISKSKLFFDNKENAYFGTKRFDRNKDERIHMQTLSNLIHANYRIPSLDYDILIKVCSRLCHNQQDVIEAFRLMLFNLFAHNRDDHGKNFSFMMNRVGEWNFSPVYDLTFSYGPSNEHSTTIAGEGKQPLLKDINKIAKIAGISDKEQNIIIDEVKTSISSWSSLANDAGVAKREINLIQKYFNTVNKI